MVVLCYQLHSPLPARKMLFIPRHTHKHKSVHKPWTQRDRHLQSVCHLFCWHLRPRGIVGETAICCRQGWNRRGKAAATHHAALFCWSELCEVCCDFVCVVFTAIGAIGVTVTSSLCQNVNVCKPVSTLLC